MESISNWLRSRAGLIMLSCILISTGSSAVEGALNFRKKTDQDSFNRATITFERAMLDPRDPTITPSQINDARERLGLSRLPEDQLAHIAERMGVTNAR